MPSINRSALLPYSAEQMYALINDVAAYPQFIDGCVGAEVFYQDEGTMDARLDLTKAGLKYSFSTRDTLTPPLKIALALIDGPFSDFQGEWVIDPLSDTACKVSFSMKFSMAGIVGSLAAKTLFSSLADNLVDSLVTRAHQLYQKG